MADWLQSDQFKEEVKYLDKTKPLYIYCASGSRSNDAGKWLRKNGFQQVLELQDGFLAWNKNQQPVEATAVVNQMTLKEYQVFVNSSPIVLVYFGAEWCPLCKKLEPVLKEFQQDSNNRLEVKKIDAGIQTTIMHQQNVTKQPTFIFYKNGKETWRKQGLVTGEEFKANLNKINQ